MYQQRAALVLTTINNPTLLNGYASNFNRYGHLEQVDVIVIPDEKRHARWVRQVTAINVREAPHTTDDVEK